MGAVEEGRGPAEPVRCSERPALIGPGPGAVCRASDVADLFEDYRLGPAWDEMVQRCRVHPPVLRGDPHHVVVGRGRDYADVPPLTGVHAGPESTGQGVEVELTRLS